MINQTDLVRCVQIATLLPSLPSPDNQVRALESLNKIELQGVLVVLQAQSVAWHDAMAGAGHDVEPNPYSDVIELWPTR